MIPQRIQSLFDFINYLDVNKREFLQYVPLCKELKNHIYRRDQLRPNENYHDKQQFDRIQDQIKEILSTINLRVWTPIKSKLKELDIWAGDEIYSSIWNNNIAAISDFKRDFKSEDVNSVIQHKTKYLGFRTETNTDFCLLLLFNELDEIFKELFNFFKDENVNEFGTFETKTIEVKSIGEALKSFKDNSGVNVKFSIPFETLQKNSDINQTQSGSAIIASEHKTKSDSSDELAHKTFNWQKWGIIISGILTIIAIIVAILLG